MRILSTASNSRMYIGVEQYSGRFTSICTSLKASFLRLYSDERLRAWFENSPNYVHRSYDKLKQLKSYPESSTLHRSSSRLLKRPRTSSRKVHSHRHRSSRRRASYKTTHPSKKRKRSRPQEQALPRRKRKDSGKKVKSRDKGKERKEKRKLTKQKSNSPKQKRQKRKIKEKGKDKVRSDISSSADIAAGDTLGSADSFESGAHDPPPRDDTYAPSQKSIHQQRDRDPATSSSSSSSTSDSSSGSTGSGSSSSFSSSSSSSDSPPSKD